ncbi:MAG: hypothetical protein KGI48_07915, partial [Hyphomicrobiales bacterium]|nr:hypothetical protein [Hyphomicrobiales bacterium]
SGKLVITSRDTKDIITIQGSGTDAAALGFGLNNDSFTPTQPKSSASSPAASSTGNASSKTNSRSSAGQSAGSGGRVSSIGQETASSAASILSASGASGSLIDMLA